MTAEISYFMCGTVMQPFFPLLDEWSQITQSVHKWGKRKKKETSKENRLKQSENSSDILYNDENTQ